MLSLSTDGVLPDLRVVRHRTATELQGMILDLVDEATAVTTRVRDVIARGVESRRDLQQLQADLGAVSTEARALRRILDEWRAIDEMVYPDAALLVRLWRWERGLRRSLVALVGSIQEASAVAAALAPGESARVIVVRDGETWQSIAQRELGDWRRWMEIVELNRTDVAAPEVGQVVEIPR